MGPTLNDSYNDCLRQWVKAGYDAKPECEVCGCDLTDEEVFETGYDWRCAVCHKKPFDGGLSDAALRREEARQLGITG